MNEESLFAAALERPAGAERSAFLDAACGDDRLLRDRVERLLAADDRSRGILDGGRCALLVACDAETRSADHPPRVSHLGEVDPPGYELSERVGEGGMGTVYRARDFRLERDVAVKFLHPRFEPGGSAAKRFLGEARVTAQLQHPGVPPVHEVGALPDGRPFLVMKLIKGKTLAELLEKSADRGRLVASFEQVCQAVAFAHAHKVIHRDLKPSNVMVGAFGEVQVMDWGLAKVLTAAGPVTVTACDEETASAGAPALDSDRGDGDATRPGSVLGTPAYMAPEQAIGAVDQVDARSDVFSLGSILSAILTGQPAYVGANSESTRQLAARARLGDALARLNRCGADPGLVELCKRCLAPEKGDRPADAGEVARAVAELRAAADERARAAELDRVRAEGERAKAAAEAREQRKRRHWQLAVAAAVGLLFAAGGAFGWYFDRQATQRRTEAAQRQAEEEGRERVEQARRQARLGQDEEAAARLLDQCEAILQSPLHPGQVEQAAIALAAAERRAADGGAHSLAGRLAKCRADLALLRELNATDNYRWAWTYDEFGGTPPDNEGIKARWRAALARYGIVIGKTPTAEAAKRITDSLVKERLLAVLDLWLALEPSALERQAGNPEGAWVRAILKSADPDWYRDAIRDATLTGGAQFRVTVVDLLNRPEALAQPARFAVVLGQFEGVSPAHRREILRSALRSRPGDLELIMALGHSYPARRQDREGVRERVRWFQAAVAVQPRSVGAHNELGAALRDKSDLAEAIAEFRKAVEIEPKDPHSHYNLGNALGTDRGNKAFAEEGLAHLRQAVELCRDCPVSHTSLGLALMMMKKSDEAIAEFRAALKIKETHVKAHVALGLALYMTTERKDEAFAHLRRAVEIARRSTDDREKAEASGALGIALARSKNDADLDEALTHLQVAVKLIPDESNPHSNLGFAWKRKAELDKALAEFREAIRLDPTNALAHAQLARVLATGPDRVRDGKQALAHGTQACELSRWEEPDSIAALAAAYAEVRDFDRACELQELALSFPAYEKEIGEQGWLILRTYAQKLRLQDASLDPRPELAPPPHKFVRPDPTGALARLDAGRALWRQKKRNEAIAEFREAVRLDPKYMPARTNLARSLALNGKPEEGIAVLREAVLLEPENASLRNALASALEDQGKLKPAIAQYREAVRLEPLKAAWYNNLASALEDDKQLDEAIKVLREGIRIKPKDTSLRHNLASLLLEKDRPHEAIAEMRAAIEINGGNEGTYLNLAQALEEVGDLDGAIKAYRTAIRMNRKIAPAHYMLGQALQKKRDLAGAIASFRKAVQLDEKGFHPFHNALAWALAVGPDGVRNGAEAVQHATRACELTKWKSGSYLDTLAAAHAEAGDFDKAVEFQKKAIESPSFPKAHLKAGRDRLELYARKQPHRDPAFAPLSTAPPPREVKP